MATFSYTLLDSSGKQKKGSIDAENRDAAFAELNKSGTVISLDEANAFNKDLNISFLQPKPKPRDMAVFCRQFVSIVNAGVPVVSALEMLGEQTENKMLAKAITDCRMSIERGETLHSSMAQHPKVFPSIFVTMVEAGEASGSLDVSFERMAEQFEKQAEIKAAIKKATVYPIVLLLLTIGAAVLLLTFVVPTFKTMFDDLGTELPGITKVVLALSDSLQGYWYIYLIVLVALIVGIKLFKKTPTGTRFFATLGLKIPVFGRLTTKTAAASMSRTLSTLVSSGLQLTDALQIVAGTMSNIYFKEDVLAARDQVMVGAPLSAQFRQSGYWPPLVYHMIAIGEDTGSIDTMLTKLAEYYEEEVKQETERVMALLEPLVILLLALVVGAIVVSVILPMASMYDSLSNL